MEVRAGQLSCLVKLLNGCVLSIHETNYLRVVFAVDRQFVFKPKLALCRPLIEWRHAGESPGVNVRRLVAQFSRVRGESFGESLGFSAEFSQLLSDRPVHDIKRQQTRRHRDSAEDGQPT